MATKVVYRSADITPKEALDGLRRKYRGARVASFGISSDGLNYEASLVFADFPQAGGGESDGGDDGGSSDGPPPPDDGGDEDDGGDDSGDAPFPPKKEKKDKGGDKGGESHEIAALTHLVKQIALAVGVPPDGGTGPAGPDETAPGGDPGMEAGPMAPPGGAGGPPPPPLPPPAHPGGGAGGPLGTPFSKVASERRSFVIWREPDADGTLPDIHTAANEVRAQLPNTHKLAQITMKRAKVDGGNPVNVYVCAITAR